MRMGACTVLYAGKSEGDTWQTEWAVMYSLAGVRDDSVMLSIL